MTVVVESPIQAEETEHINESITENFSQKPKRGRPKSYQSHLVDLVYSNTTDVDTRRGQENWAYLCQAMGVLGFKDDPTKYPWLYDPKLKTPKKKTILTELGRIQDPAYLRFMADAICQNKPTTAQAVVAIRQLRTGRSPAPSADELSTEINKLLDSYRVRRPDTTASLMLDALRLTTNRVVGIINSEMEEEQE